MADDRYHIGSCTKSMTASAIARAIVAEQDRSDREGKPPRLTWETTLREALLHHYERRLSGPERGGGALWRCSLTGPARDTLLRTVDVKLDTAAAAADGSTDDAESLAVLMDFLRKGINNKANSGAAQLASYEGLRVLDPLLDATLSVLLDHRSGLNDNRALYHINFSTLQGLANLCHTLSKGGVFSQVTHVWSKWWDEQETFDDRMLHRWLREERNDVASKLQLWRSSTGVSSDDAAAAAASPSVVSQATDDITRDRDTLLGAMSRSRDSRIKYRSVRSRWTRFTRIQSMLETTLITLAKSAPSINAAANGSSSSAMAALDTYMARQRQRHLALLRDAERPLASAAEFDMTWTRGLPTPKKASAGAFGYSNFGYALSAHIAELTTGVPWEQLLHHEIFKPLRMSTAGLGAPYDTVIDSAAEELFSSEQLTAASKSNRHHRDGSEGGSPTASAPMVYSSSEAATEKHQAVGAKGEEEGAATTAEGGGGERLSAAQQHAYLRNLEHLPDPPQPIGHYTGSVRKPHYRTYRPALRLRQNACPDFLAPAGDVHLSMEDWLAYLHNHLVNASLLCPEPVFAPVRTVWRREVEDDQRASQEAEEASRLSGGADAPEEAAGRVSKLVDYSDMATVAAAFSSDSEAKQKRKKGGNALHGGGAQKVPSNLQEAILAVRVAEEASIAAERAAVAAKSDESPSELASRQSERLVSLTLAPSLPLSRLRYVPAPRQDPEAADEEAVGGREEERRVEGTAPRERKGGVAASSPPPLRHGTSAAATSPLMTKILERAERDRAESNADGGNDNKMPNHDMLDEASRVALEANYVSQRKAINSYGPPNNYRHGWISVMTPETGTGVIGTPSSVNLQPWALLHDGSNAAFMCYCVVVPARGIAVCVATNATGLGVGPKLMAAANEVIRKVTEGGR